MNRISVFLTIVFTFVILNLGAQTSKIKTQKTAGGLEYKIITPNKGPRVAAGDMVFFKMRGKIGDSTLYDSYRNPQVPYWNMVVKENFKKGNFEEGLTLLTKGDSAMFLINIDSFFSAYIGTPVPAFVKKGERICFNIIVDSFITKTVLAQRKALQELEIASREQNESKLLNDYLTSTGLTYTRTTSGMYYVITKKTTGEKAKAGDQVSAIYTGRLLNGKVFDSNKTSGQPFEFPLGAHRVIAGWDEIFSILNVGEEATIVLPSTLAYGAQGAGADIAPFSPLVFDVEFVKITKAE